MSKFIYFPSFSAGAMGSSLAKNVKLKNDLSIRFYSDEFPEKYRHTDILITAGHHFKKDDYKNDLGLTDKNLVMVTQVVIKSHLVQSNGICLFVKESLSG